MLVRDIMTANPIVVRPETTLHHALHLMQDHEFNHLPIVNTTGGLIGIVSNRDCRLALHAPHLKTGDWRESEMAEHIMVRSIMSPAPIVIAPTALATDAAEKMMEHQIGCLPVLQSETIVGILTRSDILAAFCKQVRDVPTS